ncbi:hydrocephalus-inducing protein-like [Guaruba guarouba]
MEVVVTLQNSGKLGFTFMVLSPSTGTAASPQPGMPLVMPSMGYLGPGKEQVLKVYYLPGVPGVFCRAFQIQLRHLEPKKISLKGEGIFPRIHLDLLRNIKGNTKYDKILKKAKEKLGKGSQRDKTIVLGEAEAAEPHTDNLGTMLDAQLQMQIEEMLIEEHALEQQNSCLQYPGGRCLSPVCKLEASQFSRNSCTLSPGPPRLSVLTCTVLLPQRGVVTWFRNGTATNPRSRGPSARRHQHDGRQNGVY